jgi:hypothetical protein
MEVGNPPRIDFQIQRNDSNEAVFQGNTSRWMDGHSDGMSMINYRIKCDSLLQ